MDPIIIYTTIDTKNNANKLSKKLIENNLAACVNIVPIDDSIYNWDGKIQSQPEFQLIIKTDVSHKELIENFFKLKANGAPTINPLYSIPTTRSICSSW